MSNKDSQQVISFPDSDQDSIGTLTLKKLLTYGTCVSLKIKLQGVKSKKVHQLFERIHLINHITMGMHIVYNSLHAENYSLIQSVTNAWCRFHMKNNECPDSSEKRPNRIPWATPNSLYCCNSFPTFPCPLQFVTWQFFLLTTSICYLLWFSFWFNFVFLSIVFREIFTSYYII